MAITTNTTASISKASTVLLSKCEKTKADMKQLMAAAGCTSYKTVKTLIPLIPGSGDDVVFVGLNGVGFYFMRGKSVEVPEPLLEIMTNCGIV